MKSPSNNTGTIRHRHKKSRPAPPPPTKSTEKKQLSEIFVGGNNSIKSQWRHQPILLITGVVKYTANVSIYYTIADHRNILYLFWVFQYLGSTNVVEFKGIESSKRSIQKVVKNKDRPIEEIVLSISYRGVKFVNPNTKVLNSFSQRFGSNELFLEYDMRT